MTTLSQYHSPRSGLLQERMNAAMRVTAERIKAYRASRRAALLDRKTDLILSELDPHILRDVGLEYWNRSGNLPLVFDSRSYVYGG